ncbi:hypothetical protein L2K20_00955 [Mycobacterium sp. MBM]|nr:hypothetical protein [Mycobacterium sp. MBM]
MIPPKFNPRKRYLSGTCIRTVSDTGNIGLESIADKVGAQRAFRPVLVIGVDDQIIVTDLDSDVIAERIRPQTKINYVGNGRPPRRTPQEP